MATAFGIKPSVQKYWDDEHELNVDILTCANPVDTRRVNYGTIGLSDHPLMDGKIEFSLRVEVTGVAFKEFDFFPNLLSTVAFYTIRHNWFCSSGAVLPNAISMYDISCNVKHLLFTTPFLWDNNLETIKLDTKEVAWLLAVPISNNEKLYLEEHGIEALETLLEKEGVDIFDLKRKSII